MKKVLLVVHPHFRPQLGHGGCERDVYLALRRLAAQVEVLAVDEDLRAVDRALARFKPQLVFNLLEEFRSEAIYDFHIVSFLEALGVRCTGCNPRGLILTRNKFQLAGWLAGRGVRTPKSALRFSSELSFPLFVKLNREDASLGIRKTNLVRNERQLRETCQRLRHDFGGEILIQEFIAGYDVSVSVWGNRRSEAFVPRRLILKDVDRVSTARLKFSRVQQRRWSARSVPLRGPLADSLRREVRRLYEELDLSGYARFDYRIAESGEAYLLDVNANPNLARGEDFALSARLEGFSYEEMLENIMGLGLGYRARR